jgi:predicted transcriptional regulator
MRAKEMKPQDILVLAKIVSMGKNPWKGQDLAAELCISKSEISESLSRSKYARLLDFSKRKANAAAFLEFLSHGIRYVYPAIAKGRQKGFLTAFSAAPLNKKIASQAIVVWPSENGNAFGDSIEPLYPAVVPAIQKDKTLYEIMSLIEAIRIGKAREIVLAENELKTRFQNYALQ